MVKTYMVSTTMPDQSRIESRVTNAKRFDWSIVVKEEGGNWQIYDYLTEEEKTIHGQLRMLEADFPYKMFVRNSIHEVS